MIKVLVSLKAKYILYFVLVPYCGGTITSNGTILSPEHPQNYPNNEDCEWVIRFPEEERIMLEFVAFNLEYAYRCR